MGKLYGQSKPSFTCNGTDANALTHKLANDLYDFPTEYGNILRQTKLQKSDDTVDNIKLET